MSAKWVITILGLGLVVPGQVLAAETWREQSRRTVPGSGLELVTIQNARGRIEAQPSPDGDVHVTALKIARGSSESAARDLARQTLVELERDGGHFTVKVRYPKAQSLHVNVWEDFGSLSVPRVEVQITVQVPSRVGIEMSSSSGDLASQGLTASQSLRTSSGEVSVESAAGRLDVSTASGDVTIADARAGRVATSSGNVEVQGAPGAFTITTTSGDVSIEAASDSLRVESTSGDVVVRDAGRDPGVRTSSGDITLRGASGRVSVTTVSGEVEARLAAPVSGASISSSSGDIRLGLGPRVGCRLELRTTSGAIEVNVSMRPETITRRLVTGSVGSGSAPVSLRSSSGSITVVSGGP